MLRKTDRYMALMTGCMLMLSACSSDELPYVAETTQHEKTPIELTVGISGEGGAMTRSGQTTRSVTTTDEHSLAKAFEKGTSLYMVMKSEEYGGTGTKYSRTMAHAQIKTDDNNTKVEFGSGYVRYYEDSYSRNSQVSIYAACVPGHYLSGSYTGSTGTVSTSAVSINNSTTYNNNLWATATEPTTIVWPMNSAVVTTQDADFISSQDLCFSNNVANPAGGTDNRIKFAESPTRGFTSGRLVFYHALTKVTFKIIKGQGFETGDFAFTQSGKNIVLTGFNTGGTFDIETGEFKTSDPAITTGVINSMCITSDTHSEAVVNGQAYQLECLMLPGTNLDNSDATITFEIDHNEYRLKKKDLMDALSGKHIYEGQEYQDDALDANKMRPGVNYVFTLTVGKKKVESLTAAVVGWEEVEANEHTPSHARILVSLLNNGSAQSGAAAFDLYRKADVADAIPANENAYASFLWTTGYVPSGNPTVNKAMLTETTSGVYKADNADADPGSSPETHTPWYWPNNKTFYHFRTVMPKNHTVTENSTYGDYITLEGKAYSSTPAESYKDVCWGAPFRAKSTDQTKPDNTDEKLTYSTGTGFDNTKSPETAEANHQISKAIGATESTINIEMFHMMSDVTIKLTTSTGTDAVTIAGATITLSNIYNNGLVRMGNGKVETTGSVADPAISGTVADVSGTYQWRYGFVPQSLASVVLTIQTTDHNLYIVDMKDVVATTVGNNLIKNPYTPIAAGNTNAGKYPIDYWYPNYKYTYTFKLTKSDISLITATLADWETVTAGDDNVQIK